jgi:hypothetical protein
MQPWKRTVFFEMQESIALPQEPKMTYSCTNPECGWRGEDPGYYQSDGRDMFGYPIEALFCPLCLSPVEDLDLQERIAMRRDAGFSEEDAERLAMEDMEKWREES